MAVDPVEGVVYFTSGSLVFAVNQDGWDLRTIIDHQETGSGIEALTIDYRRR